MPITLRQAHAGDLSGINAIYNHFVLNSTCTYQTEPSTLDERRRWFDEHLAAGVRLPVFIACDSQRPESVLGWGSLSPFHPRQAYCFTVEDSVYVHHEFHRRGIGQMLLQALLAHAEKVGYHAVVALISADQAASVELHRKVGFTEAGQLREVGFKFDRWLDVLYMQRNFAFGH